MKIGFLGLPFSGKTTLFEAITGAHGADMAYGAKAGMATVTVPDERLEAIAEISQPRKVTHAHIDFVDATGVSRGDTQKRTATVLASLRDADGLVHVIRFFEWAGAPPHPRGTLDPQRDIDEMATELIVADLEVVERRISKLRQQLKRGTPHREQEKRELALQEELQASLEAGRPVADIELSTDEHLLLRAFQLLGLKPVLPVLNVHEDEIDSEATRTATTSLGPDAVVISARIEKEISELDPEERGEFIDGLGLSAPAAQRVIRACYRTLGLRSFFTGANAGEELRAWTVHAGDTALIAAGKIHSDIQRGFIRAEVISYDDFAAAGSAKAARTQNQMHLEGKDYIVQDGDMILFRFKV